MKDSCKDSTQLFWLNFLSKDSNKGFRHLILERAKDFDEGTKDSHERFVQWYWERARHLDVMTWIGAVHDIDKLDIDPQTCK